jgi:hypothetical protein
MAAQAFDILYQILCGVVLCASGRFASAAAALVEQNNAVISGFEKASLSGIASAAGAAMKYDNGCAGAISALLVIKIMCGSG